MFCSVGDPRVVTSMFEYTPSERYQGIKNQAYAEEPATFWLKVKCLDMEVVGVIPVGTLCRPVLLLHGLRSEIA